MTLRAHTTSSALPARPAVAVASSFVPGIGVALAGALVAMCLPLVQTIVEQPM